LKLGKGGVGEIIEIDKQFVKCSKEKHLGIDLMESLKKKYVLKLIERGAGNDNVANELAALNCDKFRGTNLTNYSLGAWRNSDYNFILIYRMHLDLQLFIKNAKQLCEEEDCKMDNSIIETFTYQMIKQLKSFDKKNVAHAQWGHLRTLGF